MGERIHFVKIFTLLLGILAAGTIGYILIEGWPLLDALYMTIITISTVGYHEVHTLSSAGKIFSSILIIGGVGTAFYAFTTIIQYIIKGHLRTIFRGSRNMEDKISKLRNHYIICGYGRVGKVVANRLQVEGVDFVVVDSDSDAIAQAKADSCLCIQEDASVGDNLIKAGIKNARGLIVVTDNDATNIFIIVTARNVKPDIHIVARSSSEESGLKLQMVGADRAMNPYSAVGERIARRALHPLVSDFIEDVFPGRGKERYLERVEIAKNSIVCGKTIAEAQKHSRGAVVLAVQKKGSTIFPKPSEDTIIAQGDMLVVLGTEQQLSSMEHMVKSD